VKACFSELNTKIDKVFNHQIKDTLGITELLKISDQSDFLVYHLDVGLTCPLNAKVQNGSIVHRLISYTSWVKNDVNQFGFYLIMRKIERF